MKRALWFIPGAFFPFCNLIAERWTFPSFDNGRSPFIIMNGTFFAVIFLIEQRKKAVKEFHKFRPCGFAGTSQLFQKIMTWPKIILKRIPCGMTAALDKTFSPTVQTQILYLNLSKHILLY